ncbi:MAG: RNA polymerase sigma factor RpoD/SigA [Candidatus Latescibacteria bacterium]|jgi:RNA polymerase primary sigma factor|nr:RNA polymerase sigma factor RpoD/SigA [Candidatus Latescibacterota bacterium]MBT4137597.1 RNA polymerase sigma factor RpoD/SigA [Candidatus Latescibacterota bacterium]MBT5832373.1 RNA polymerase sigma factor RpoD/SigA [Candidatus Latescibacterota bacterium]
MILGKQFKNSDLGSYFKDVRKTHPLTREEEQKLSERIKKGNLRARNQLVTANLRFALDVAKRYQGRGLPLEDLISSANLGLLEAAKRFDGKNGVRFITYAVWWIRRYILKALSGEQHLIHLPGHVVDLLSKVQRVSRELQQTLERSPTTDEIAAEMNETVAKVQLVLNSNRDVCSFDDLGSDQDCSLLEKISDPRIEDKLEPVEQIGQTEEVEFLLDSLTPREADVVRKYYGLDGLGGDNLAEIGRELDLSRERVRQIKTSALKHLKVRARGLYRQLDWSGEPSVISHA